MKHLTYKELKAWQIEGKPFRLIDVREPDEHEAYNIGGELIPLNDFIKKARKMTDKDPIIVYCKKGIRSQIAIQRIAPLCPDLDFYNLANGILFIRDSLIRNS